MNSEQENKEMIGEKVKKITLLWKYIALNVFHRANWIAINAFLFLGLAGRNEKRQKKERKDGIQWELLKML